MAETLMVGMGEVKITRSVGGVLIALGLGSCIGVCAYDPQAHVAGMAHVVLPDSAGNADVPGKFADTAVPFLMEAMHREGASISRIRVALAGGAQLFRHQGTGARLDVGPRNAEAVQAALERLNIRPIAMDVGGSAGRTVHLYHDGVVRVKTIGQPERDLVALGSSERAHQRETFRISPEQNAPVVPLRKAA